jgi:spore coat protein A, manganese oxidase
MDRRKFLKIMGMAGAGAAMTGIPWRFDPRRGFQSNEAWAFYQSMNLPLFSQTLRSIDTIPVAASDGTLQYATGPAVTHYSIAIGQFTDTLCPAGDTILWGYQPSKFLTGATTQRHLGGIIVAQKGTPVQITFTNNLPTAATSWGQIHPLPVDITIPGADKGALQNRTAVHLHGGLVPWISDGGPFDWFTPGNNGTGASFQNGPTSVLDVAPFNLVAGQAAYYYPNQQSARLVWYHDHAFGITRINAYAGIASAYIIRDTGEAALLGGAVAESVATAAQITAGQNTYIEHGGPEIPIVIQDKIFVGPNILTAAGGDPTWPGPTAVGSLWYPHVYERNRWKLQGNTGSKSAKNLAPLDPSVIPEMFGDTMLANGTVYPKIKVAPQRYRLRILNACNARFLNLQLLQADSTLASANGITLNPATGVAQNPAGPSFLVLGTEGGFLSQAVSVPSNTPFNPVTLAGSLITGNAERWDVIVDFSTLAGKSYILYNDAPAPFPIGDPRNDYFPNWNTKANPVNLLTTPGSGPNTREIMRFDVDATVPLTAAQLPVIKPGTDLTGFGIDPFLTPIVAGVPTVPTLSPANVLPKTLNETFDAYGRLIQMLGTGVAQAGGTYGQPYTNTPTEVVANNTEQMWEIYNLTGDTHPIHFHLVNVQIINRQAFKVNQFNPAAPVFMGGPTPPAPYELGWKETVRMNPGEVTRVLMKFVLPAVPFIVPPSNRTGGNEYVWHCHILEHEEHDMMRPIVVN